MKQRAVSLRIRLRLAHFKVETDQVDIPFARLKSSINLVSSIQEELRPDPAPSQHMTNQPGLDSRLQKEDLNLDQSSQLLRNMSTPRRHDDIRIEANCANFDKEHPSSSAIRGDAAHSLLGLAANTP